MVQWRQTPGNGKEGSNMRSGAQPHRWLDLRAAWPTRHRRDGAGAHLGEFLAAAGLRSIQAHALDGPIVALGLASADDFDRTLGEVRLAVEQQAGSIQPFFVACGQKV
jgi:hypothetical protein